VAGQCTDSAPVEKYSMPLYMATPHMDVTTQMSHTQGDGVV